MSSYNATETLSTLRFGSRAKKIKNKPTANIERSPKKLMMMLDEANKKLERQLEAIVYLNNRVTSTLKNEEYKVFVSEFNEVIKMINSDDAKGLYKIFKEGYVEELKNNEEPIITPISSNPLSDKDKTLLDKERQYLNKKLSQSTKEILNLYIEVSESKKLLENLKEEKKELETDRKEKINDIVELNDKIRAMEFQNKLQIEEFGTTTTQLELRIENVSFVYDKRCKDIDQLCKSLDRILFDEGLITSAFTPIKVIYKVILEIERLQN